MRTHVGYRVKLKDGRSICCAQYGQPEGKPIMHFHGTPSSRLEGNRASVKRTAEQLGVRLLFPDRPGIGGSDFQPQRTLLDWADDVSELADHLELDQFAVLGLSGGVPHAAACAYKMPERLTAVGLMGGISPTDTPTVFDGMNRSNRWQITIARKAPWLLRLLFWQVARELDRKPESVIEQLAEELSEPDKVIVMQTDFKASLLEMVREAFRSGARGVAWDQALIARDWGFPLDEIKTKTYLWHGEMDKLCPVAMGQYMAASIPNCSASFFPNEGHISLYVNHYREILATLVAVC